jgi:predicted translin family RNA/ssDNA-binding protein
MLLVGIDELAQTIKRNDERYRAASERSWEINAALIRCQMTRENITSCVVDPMTAAAATIVDVDTHLDKLIAATIGCKDMYDNIVHEKNNDTTRVIVTGVHPRAPRLGSLGHKMEDYARYKAFQHFLLHGKMISIHADLTSTTVVSDAVVTSQQNNRNILTDEEYISGVCIGLCHDLAKHCVQLASNAVHNPNAVPFINTSRDAVSAILEELLQFDFRNGPIRRKYDSVKYALKTIETVLYELSVAGAVGGHSHLLVTNDETKKEVHEAKKIKVNDNEDVKNESHNDVSMMMEEEGTRQDNVSSSIIPVTEIAEIRERFDHRDQQRETLIKACRDGQKSAKQAIFALHRGDVHRALKLLKECESCVNDELLPIIKDEPSLRYGSYSSLLEEYVEGILFFTWLQPNTEDTTSTTTTTTTSTTTTPSGKILLPVEIPLTISTEEYLGGLCDLTGEIGRYAVARGTVRDRDGVQLCLEANKSIYNALKLLGKLPSNINKKMSMVNQGVEKLERLLYEQSLILMTGRKEFNSSVEENSGFEDTTNVAEEK